MRRAFLVAALLGLGALVAGAGARRPAAAHALERVVGVAIEEIETVAGLAGAATPLGVVPRVPSSAPAWSRRAVVRAVERAEHLRARPAAAAVLQVETLGGRGAFAVRLSLWRRGWSVVSPRPVIGHAAPVAALATVVLLALADRRRPWRVAVLAALMGQGVAAWLAATVAAPGLSPGERILASAATGPVARVGVAALQAEPPWGAALLGGFAAAGLVLAWADHRRAARRGHGLPGPAAVGAVVAVFAGLAAVEAALRLGLWDLARTVPGGLAVLAAGAGVWVLRHARRSAGPPEALA